MTNPGTPRLGRWGGEVSLYLWLSLSLSWFIVNSADDCLSMAFPPRMPQMQHVAINTQAAQEFGRRTDLPCRVIPNVRDFANPPESPDE